VTAPAADPFSVKEHEAGGRFAIVCPPSGDVARLLEVVGAGEWLAIHADPHSGLAA
jgi:hypothetical protein